MNTSKFHAVIPLKELGQNFLTDASVARQMLDALTLQDEEIILEIGPGLGILTGLLAQKLTKPKDKIYAVEIDKRLIEQLQQRYKNKHNLEIIEGDILDWLHAFKPEKPIKVVGSLPYYITSPILHLIIRLPVLPTTVVILIQKEVGEKICARVPDASYLSTFVQTFFDAEYVSTVERKKFYPVPQVDGAVIKLTKKSRQLIGNNMIKKYEGFLHKGFSNPRKMLNKVFTKEELDLVDVDPSLRPQNLDVVKWVLLFGS